MHIYFSTFYFIMSFAFEFKHATLFLTVIIMLVVACSAQLSPTYYATTCPNLTCIVTDILKEAEQKDVRIGAKLIRLHFHDCFVDGCDGSLLLDSADGIVSEKQARPNNNSAAGFEVVDDIKKALENACPGVVSCADILAISAQIGVSLAGGQTWDVELGRRDGRTVNLEDAQELPGPFDTLDELIEKFSDVDLDITDMVALSGAHTFGRSKCRNFDFRLFNFSGTGSPDPTIDPTFLKSLQEACPQNGNRDALNNLDVSTPNSFDNKYFTNLLDKRGLLKTDQFLFSTSGAQSVEVVSRFASSEAEFFKSFGEAMISMGKIEPLTGSNGEIRVDCRKIN